MNSNRSMLYHDTVILVFAKAPVDGEVNTRLIPDIGVQAATRLQHELLHQRLSMLCEAELCDVRLLCAPDSLHEKFLPYKKQYPVDMHDQCGGHLGLRMASAIDDALQLYDHCIIIGTDAPALDADRIKQAIDVLHAGCDMVIVPAEDGGYVLIGARRACRQECNAVFEGISWGSAAVMQQTRERLEVSGLTYRQLAACWDIDRIEDYQRYLSMLSVD